MNEFNIGVTMIIAAWAIVLVLGIKWFPEKGDEPIGPWLLLAVAGLVLAIWGTVLTS